MSLTGPLLEWLLWVAALALFVWCVVGWARWARPGWWPVVVRILHQLGIVTLVVLALAVTLNDDYLWYADWSDLLGGGGVTAAGVVTAGAAASAAAAVVPGGTRPGAGLAQLALEEPALHLRQHPGVDGQYRDFVIPGPTPGSSGRLTVWFPTDYTEKAFQDRRYAVLEAFHGVPGTPTQYTRTMRLGNTMAAVIGRAELADTVVVMPWISPGGVDTECVDGGAGGIPMETWLTDTVTGWVDQHLRVDTSRSAWATMGFSAGGYCATMLAMLHPALYSAAISLGGYYQAEFEGGYQPFTAGSPEGRHYDLVRLAQDAPPPTALWVQTSPADPLSYGSTTQLLHDARPPLSVTAEILPDAGHRLGVWNPLIPGALQWLGQVAPGFRPGGAGTMPVTGSAAGSAAPVGAGRSTGAAPTVTTGGATAVPTAPRTSAAPGAGTRPTGRSGRRPATRRTTSSAGAVTPGPSRSAR
ncbi:alpha/beta hydrolase [Nakamurella endophytica]|uniref:Esterase n=1 Tax=Nakamurella endophytica TaxID=1748367 RepID=A0A917SQ56_9ACTN|nr:alpha/beta hydrolase-fold protein [Nakamurella endophytica]GGL92051.1 hypothetical protein GCM10011594_09760 [Nakamurella endophytica]